jgi:serine/threonine-protein kinase
LCTSSDLADSGSVVYSEPVVIGTTLDNRYLLEKELGRGGMGAVYRAKDIELERYVAIKVLKEQAADELGQRIRIEARILARLEHPNIVPIYDFRGSDGLYYFVMQEVAGSSFFRRIRELDLPGRLRVMASVSEALDYAHHQCVIHRDVKPANVLMTELDVPKLSDFGLSVLTDGTQTTGKVRGTPSYMSPEQAKGRKLDYRSDIYAIGVMLYECATGAPPFNGPPFAVIASHLNAEPEPPRSKNEHLSVELEAFILKILAKAPEDRPGSAGLVAEALRYFLATDPTLQPGFAGNITPQGTFNPPIANPRRENGPTLETRVSPPTRNPTEPTRIAAPSIASIPESSASMLDSDGSAPSQAAVSVAPLSVEQSPLAKRILSEVTVEPIMISADERFLAGHYLAYLLGGSRRRGFLRKRPLDPLNADRARLLLAMTWLMLKGATTENLATASELLASKVDVRPSLSPVIVSKYLASRDSAAKRKTFRDARRRLHDASDVARERLTDEKGVLNPGLMPQVLDDLRKISPSRTEVDDKLIERWNRVTEVWRGRPDFRKAVLSYATTFAALDPASPDLWPEVVYPLIERARWQRKLRSKSEVVWDNICEVLHIPDAGNSLEKAVRTIVPARVVEELDKEVIAFSDEPELDNFDEPAAAVDPTDRLASRVNSSSFSDLDTSLAPEKGLVRLTHPDPFRFTQGELHTLFKEGITSLQQPGSRAVHRPMPLGPYRLAVIPSIRSRSASQVAIQGMPNKQIELLTPSLRTSSSGSKPLVAVWLYQDNSIVIAYIDFQASTKYIFWQSTIAHQNNFDDPAELNHALYYAGLEAPDGLNLALTKRFRPKNPA